MAVYVDPMMSCIPNGRWRWTRSCHMFADTVDELHAMASVIGLRRAWFQPSPPHRFPHYDLHESRRRAAVFAGVVELDRRQAVEKWTSLARRSPQREEASHPP